MFGSEDYGVTVCFSLVTCIVEYNLAVMIYNIRLSILINLVLYFPLTDASTAYVTYCTVPSLSSTVLVIYRPCPRQYLSLSNGPSEHQLFHLYFRADRAIFATAKPRPQLPPPRSCRDARRTRVKPVYIETRRSLKPAR